MTAPFGRRICVVLSRVALGAYVVLEVEDDCVSASAGQFYMLAGVDGWGGGDAGRPFVGRAISALTAAGDGTISFLIEDVGPGTHQLVASDRLFVVGPLGKGFVPPAEGSVPLLVGGGVGIPPLVMAQAAWGGRALVGFRDAHHAEAASLLRNPEIATDDGSIGHHGPVTELLDHALEEAPPSLIYGCGPPAMLEQLRLRAGRHGVPTQLAVESPMACGFGSCWGCVVNTTDGYKRVCVDGPVFDAAVLL